MLAFKWFGLTLVSGQSLALPHVLHSNYISDEKLLVSGYSLRLWSQQKDKVTHSIVSKPTSWVSMQYFTVWFQHSYKVLYSNSIYTCSSKKQSLWFLVTLHNKTLCIFVRNFHLSFTTLLHYLVKFEIPSTSFSNRTGPRHIQNTRPPICLANDAKNLFHAFCGHPTVQIQTALTTVYAAWGFCKTAFTRTRSRMWNWQLSKCTLR